MGVPVFPPDIEPTELLFFLNIKNIHMERKVSQTSDSVCILP